MLEIVLQYELWRSNIDIGQYFQNNIEIIVLKIAKTCLVTIVINSILESRIKEFENNIEQYY